MVVVAGVAFTVALWRADLLSHRWQSVCSVTFSPDGRTVVAGLYSGMSFNEDDHWCIADIGQTVALFGADTGSSRGVLDDVRYQGTSWGLPSTPLGQFLGFSPDGRTLAAATWDGTVKLWDPATRQLTGILRTQCHRVTALSFSRDGRKLAVGCRNSLILWNTANYGEGRQLGSATTSVRSIAFSPDSESIAIGSEHSFRGAELWDVAGASLKQSVPITEDGVLALEFGSNGRYLAMGGRRTAVLWDLSQGRAQFEVEGPWTAAVALSPDCKTLATAGADGLRFWRTATGDPTGAIWPGRRIRSLAYSPDGSMLAAGDDLGFLTVWDTSSVSRRWSARVSGPGKFDRISVLSGIVGLGLLSMAMISGCWSARRRFWCHIPSRDEAQTVNHSWRGQAGAGRWRDVETVS
jgi:WD40 repeat protein